MATKLLTIVVPAYNVAAYIAQCLDSIIQQTDDRWRLIIVNDGSTDGRTGAIAEQYALKNPGKVRYIEQENKGLGAARNTGLAEVDTAYVGFLDSDDWLPPDYVAEFFRTIERQDEPFDIVFTCPTIYDAVTGACHDWYDAAVLREIFAEETVVDPKQDPRLYGIEVNACRKILSMDFIKQMQFTFPEGLKWEDVYPHYRLLSHASRCMAMTDCGFYYRINTPGQITKSTDRGRLDIIPVFEQTFDFLKAQNAPDEVICCAMAHLATFALWSIGVANTEVRRELTDEVAKLLHRIPRSYIKTFCKKKAGKRQKLFLFCMLHGRLRRIFYDYLTTTVARAKVERIYHLCVH